MCKWNSIQGGADWELVISFYVCIIHIFLWFISTAEVSYSGGDFFFIIKFMFFKKPTKILYRHRQFDTYLVNVKSTVKIWSIFVAFLENMNTAFSQFASSYFFSVLYVLIKSCENTCAFQTGWCRLKNCDFFMYDKKL